MGAATNRQMQMVVRAQEGKHVRERADGCASTGRWMALDGPEAQASVWVIERGDGVLGFLSSFI